MRRFRLLTAAVLAGFVFAAAANHADAATTSQCQPPPPLKEGVQPKEVTLNELLRRPRQASARWEQMAVFTEGWLLRVRPVTVRSNCPGEKGKQFRVWLNPRKPAGNKRSINWQTSVVAQVSAAVVRDQLGNEQELDKLVGSRIRVAGRLVFGSSHRGELNRTRGTLWEVRPVTGITPCGNTPCPPRAPQQPTASPQP